MTYEKLCRDFLLNKEKSNIRYEVSADETHCRWCIRMVKMPICDGLTAVYGIQIMEPELTPMRFSMREDAKTVFLIVHDQYLIPCRGAWDLDHALNSMKPIKEENQAHRAALKKAAEKIVLEEALYSEKDLSQIDWSIRCWAGKVFFGEEIAQAPDSIPDFNNVCDDELVSMALALPDYEKAAKIWLSSRRRYRDFSYDLIIKTEAKKLADAWEADKNSDMYRMREIMTAIDGTKSVDVVFDRPDSKATFTAKISKQGFIPEPGDCRVMVCCACPRKTVDMLSKFFGTGTSSVSSVSIDRLAEIRYRGKTVYRRPSLEAVGDSAS